MTCCTAFFPLLQEDLRENGELVRTMHAALETLLHEDVMDYLLVEGVLFSRNTLLAKGHDTAAKLLSELSHRPQCPLEGLTRNYEKRP